MRFYDYLGKEITRDEWLDIFEKIPKTVAKEVIGYGPVRNDIQRTVTISTVWLGMCWRQGLGEKPLIYETMIFGGERDGDQVRYSTIEEAKKGHHREVYATKVALGILRQRKDESFEA